MVKTDFRYLAKQALARAQAELAAMSHERVNYAALELRYAMEAVTYDRALAFKAEIPPEEYKTWQPRRLMQVLHDIDPSIGLSSTIAVGLQDDPDTPAPPERMRLLGSDIVFTLADLKTHYDAIGNYLHMPSLAQLEKGSVPDPAKLRDRCETVASVLDKVLSSRIWNSTMGQFSELAQCLRCEKPVRKRMPHGQKEIAARCFECNAEYTLTDEGGGKILWEPKMEEVACQTAGCEKKMSLWRDELRPGTNWTCPTCKARWTIALGIQQAEPEPDQYTIS